MLACSRWCLRLVLIESDWNLKFRLHGFSERDHAVLIESDWNLKLSCNDFLGDFCHGINRIRLEFKVSSVIIRERLDRCINRIRLEFKDRRSMEYLRKVLRINRIRLEFKGYQRLYHSRTGRY